MIIDVRLYQDDDLDFVNCILREAFSLEKSNFNNPNSIEIVSICDGLVSGYLLLTKVLNPILHNYYYLVDYVCVHSNYRGLGVGEELMKFAEDYARGDHAMYLQLTCGYEREHAHKLYEKCGFIKRNSDIYRKVLE